MTSDIELLEIFFAHTISPVCIAGVMVIFMSSFIGKYHVVLGLIAFVSYCVVGILIPIVASKYTRNIGEKQRTEFGEMNTYYLDSIRGMKEIKQFHQEEKRMQTIVKQTEEMKETAGKIKAYTGITTGITNTCVFGFSVAIFLVSIYLYVTNQITIEAVIIPTFAIFHLLVP